LTYITSISQKIDHTHLSLNTDIGNIKQLCKEALKYNFHSVCIYSNWINIVKNLLEDSSIQICTVVGFPSGNDSTLSKLNEMQKSINEGATEIDMVMNIKLFKEKKYQFVLDEIKKMVECSKGNILKVIIESGILTKKELVIATQIVEDSGAEFIKTSTGFSKFGASIENINLIKKNITSDLKIKASGGIKTLNQIIDLVNSGVDRIGTSSGVIIMKEITKK